MRHVIAMILAQLSHALSLNDICDCLRFYIRISCSDSGLCSAEQEWSGSCERAPGCRTCRRIIWGSIGQHQGEVPSIHIRRAALSGGAWQFRRTIHVVNSTTILLIAKCMNLAKHRAQKDNRCFNVAEQQSIVLQSLPRVGNRGVFQGNQTDNSTGRFPRNPQERH